jgi:two-component system response regulator AtoC
VKVNVRVIAASNKDIEEEVEKGYFRKDLMYRLNAVTIHLPPLRERKEDIPLLAEHFGREVVSAGAHAPTFSAAALEILENYDWPGNIRELENAVLHAVSLSDDLIYPEHLPARIRFSQQSNAISFNGMDSENGQHGPAAGNDKWLSLAEMEENYVARVLKFTDGNKQAASRILNIDRKTLARIIKRTEGAP